MKNEYSAMKNEYFVLDDPVSPETVVTYSPSGKPPGIKNSVKVLPLSEKEFFEQAEKISGRKLWGRRY